jgi:hypothetical protein
MRASATRRARATLVDAVAGAASDRLGTVALVLAAVAFVVPWVAVTLGNWEGVYGLVGFDFQIYVDAAARWLTGGSFYLPHQLAGPYAITNGDVLYPPFGVYLFIPFIFVPGPLWWLIPGVLVGVAGWRLRPSRLGLALAILCLLPPIAVQEILKGNPVIWAVAFESLALTGIPSGPLAILKTSLFPFALIGVRQRGWWFTLVLLLLATLPLGGLTGDWLAAVLNSNGGPLYSVKDVPLMLAPLALWVGSRTRAGSLVAPGLSQRPLASPGT